MARFLNVTAAAVEAQIEQGIAIWLGDGHQGRTDNRHSSSL